MNNQESEIADATEDELITFLTHQANQAWKAEPPQPYLLSNVTPDLKAQGKSYRGAVGEKGLAQWALSAEQHKFTVVRHPTQKAKVGVIPFGEVYVFPEKRIESNAENQPLQTTGARRTKPIIVRFLESLSRLEQSDLVKIEIPVDIIAKLMKE